MKSEMKSMMKRWKKTSNDKWHEWDGRWWVRSLHLAFISYIYLFISLIISSSHFSSHPASLLHLSLYLTLHFTLHLTFHLFKLPLHLTLHLTLHEKQSPTVFIKGIWDFLRTKIHPAVHCRRLLPYCDHLETSKISSHLKFFWPNMCFRPSVQLWFFDPIHSCSYLSIELKQTHSKGGATQCFQAFLFYKQVIFFLVPDADKAINNHSQLVSNARFVLDRLREVSSVPCVLQAVESDQTVR